MATNKQILLLVALFAAITVAAEAAAPPPPPALPAEWTAANKSISEMRKIMAEACDGVVAAAGPDKAKKEQAEEAAVKHMLTAIVVLARAKETGDEAKVIDTARAYKFASTMVIKAPPAQKLRVMDEAFFSVAVPECPSSVVDDKPYCDTVSKIDKASGEVISAAPPGKTEQVAGAVAELRHASDMTVNKAYVEDPKRFPEVLAAYTKASDAVIAAAPAEKLKVMEEAFTAATAQAPSAEKPKH